MEIRTTDQHTSHGSRWHASGTVWFRKLAPERDPEGLVTGRTGSVEVIRADYFSTLRKTEAEAISEVLAHLSTQARQITEGGSND
jgi:hypothetical protein